MDHTSIVRILSPRQQCTHRRAHVWALLLESLGSWSAAFPWRRGGRWTLSRNFRERTRRAAVAVRDGRESAGPIGVYSVGVESHIFELVAPTVYLYTPPLFPISLGTHDLQLE